MTNPVFRPFGATSIHDPSADPVTDERTLHAEHGRRLVRDALATYRWRCLQHGHAYTTFTEGAEAPAGYETPTYQGSRASVAQWAYRGPWRVFVPPVVAERLGDGETPTIRLLIQCVVSTADVRLAVINPDALLVPESAMTAETDAGVSPRPGWAARLEPSTDRQVIALDVPVRPGRNTIWLGVRCELGDEVESISTADAPLAVYVGVVPKPGPFDLLSARGPKELAAFLLRTGDPGDVPISEPAPEYALRIGDPLTDPNPEPYTIGLRSGGTFADFVTGDFEGEFFIAFENPGDAASDFQTTSDITTAAASIVKPGANPQTLIYELGVIEFLGFAWDGERPWMLADRGYGASMRAYQRRSAREFRSAAEEVRTAHIARMPLVRCWDDTRQLVAPRGARPYTLGQAGLWRTLAPVSGAGPFAFATATLGPASSIQEVTPGSQIGWECMLSAFIADRYRLGGLANTPPRCRVRVRLMANAATVVATGDWSIIEADSYAVDGTDNRYSSALWRSVWRAAVPSLGGPGGWGGDGLTRRDDWRLWIPATCSVSVDPSTLSDTSMYWLQLQVEKIGRNGVGTDVAGRVFALSDVAIRTLEV
jgi:hypothetical protein